MNDITSKKIDALIPSVGPADANDIVAALAILDITQTEIAEQCNDSREGEKVIRRQNVRDIITGKQRSLDIASCLAVVLGVSIKRLFGDSYNYTPKTLRKAA